MLLMLVVTSLSAQQVTNCHHTISLQGAQLTVIQNAWFPFGSSSACPEVDTLWMTRTGNTYELNLLYDNTVPFPQFQCTRIDTIIDSITSCSPCELVVNAHIMGAYDTTTWPTGLDTLWYDDSDTSHFSFLTVQPIASDHQVKVYPNPVSSFIKLEGLIEPPLMVTLLDMTGKLIKEFEYDYQELDVEAITAGVYLLIVQFKDGQSITEQIFVK